MFLEVINQKRRSGCTDHLSPRVIAALIAPTLSLKCFDEQRSVHALHTCMGDVLGWGGRVGGGGSGGSWAGLHAPTLSARCGRDLHKSLAATAVHQIHTHLWAAIIW